MAEMTGAMLAKRAGILSDKAELWRIIQEHDRETGFVTQLDVDLDALRASMIAHGIRREDNSFSCEIIRARDGED